MSDEEIEIVEIKNIEKRVLHQEKFKDIGERMKKYESQMEQKISSNLPFIIR
jgi:hypothetical protein